MTKDTIVSINNNFFNDFQKAIKSNSEKGLKKLFNDGDKIKKDSISDSRSNKEDIAEIKNNIKKSEDSSKAAKRAQRKAQKLKKQYFFGHEVKSAKTNGNTIDIVVKIAKGKTAKGSISYGDDGSRIVNFTFDGKTTTKIIDKDGNLRKKTVLNKKTDEKIVSQYDANGIINKKTITNENDLEYKETFFYDDNGKLGYKIDRNETRTQKIQYEYNKRGKTIGNFITTTDGETGKTTKKYEANIDFNSKLRAVKKNDKLIGEFIAGYTNKNGNRINGKIDDFEQGQTGDCWLLSSIISLNSTEAGKKIIKDMIKKNRDGSVTVTFKNIGMSSTGTSYTITPKELSWRGYKKSGGDIDVVALEIAAEMLRRDGYNGAFEKNNLNLNRTTPRDFFERDDLEGGQHREAWYYFTGQTTNCNYTKNEKEIRDIVKKFAQNSETTLLGFSLYGNNYKAKALDEGQHNFICKLSKGEGHAFSVTKATNDTVTIVNPWDSATEYTISIDDFVRFIKIDESNSITILENLGNIENDSFLDGYKKALNSNDSNLMESLFSNSKTKKEDNITDSAKNIKDIKNIKNLVANGSGNAKAIKNAQKLKPGDTFLEYSIKNVTVVKNVAHVILGDKNEKTMISGTIAFGEDGCCIATLTCEDEATTLTKVINKDGTLREEITLIKDDSKIINEFDENGIINKMTVIDNNDPMDETTYFCDDKGFEISCLVKNKHLTQETYYEYNKFDQLIGSSSVFIKNATGEVIKKFSAIYNDDLKIEAKIMNEKLEGQFVALYENKEDENYYFTAANGEIDDFRQDSVKDKQFLDTLNTLNSTEEGKEIIRNMIKKNLDGSITITFKNVANKPNGISYNISTDELAIGYYENSYGDVDVLALELAYKKLKANGMQWSA